MQKTNYHTHILGIEGTIPDDSNYACVLPYAVYLEYGGEPLPEGTWGVEIIGKRIIPLRDVKESEDA